MRSPVVDDLAAVVDAVAAVDVSGLSVEQQQHRGQGARDIRGEDLGVDGVRADAGPVGDLEDSQVAKLAPRAEILPTLRRERETGTARF